MTTIQLILKEVFHRKLNFALSLLGVVGAVTLYVFFFTSSEASKKETARLMRDLGLNLRIISANTDMNRFWWHGFSDQMMPEDYVNRLASQHGLNYAHLLAMLQKKVLWRDREVILTGLLPEVSPVDRRKPSMSFTIKPQTIYVGYELATGLGLKKGQKLEIFGKTFTIARCLAEAGSDDDIRIYGHLADIQALLKLPGQINEIKALNCLCVAPTQDPLAVLREQLRETLPDTKVVQMRAIADAREKQRRTVERYLAFIMPFVLVISVVWVGVLSMMNVRERRQEIGILRAIGHGSGRIAALFLGKAFLVGTVGAAVGFAVGTGVALAYGPEIFKITAKMIRPTYALLGWSVVGASVFAMLASFIPTTIAVTQDPAVTLSQE